MKTFITCKTLSGFRTMTGLESPGRKQPANFWKVFAIAAVSFSLTSINSYGQGNPQGLWIALGPDSMATFRSAIVNNSLRANNAHILFNAQIDSILRAMQAIIDNTLSVGSDIMVGGSGSISGLLNVGSHLLIDGTGSSITSSSGFLGFGSNNLTTTGNISADSIAANYMFSNGLGIAGQTQTGSLLVNQNSQLGYAAAFKLTADSIIAKHITANAIFAGTIDAGQYLLNGLPLVSSQWVSTGNDIYFQGGNVGINTSNPSFPLQVDGNAAVTGTIFADRIAAQTGISIGQFRFINGAIQPGQADTIRTPSRLAVVADAQYVSFLADTVRMGNVQVSSRQAGTKITTETEMEVAAQDKLTISSTSDTIRLAAGTTVIAPAGTPAPATPLVPLALDVVGNVRASGNFTANSLDVSGAVFDSLQVKDSIKVGHSIWLGGLMGNTNNHIYSTNGDLFINSVVSTTGDFNTILNTNLKNVGIGTTNPKAKLHLKGSFRYEDGNQNAGYVLTSDVGGNATWQANADDGNWTRPGGNIMHTTNLNDNVGIGTTGPTSQLYVYQPSTSATLPMATFFNNNISGTGNGIQVILNSFSGTDNYLLDLQTNFGSKFYVREDGNVGIGTASPGARLEVAGQVKITGGAPGLNKILTSDASGLASWQTITAIGGISGSGTLNYLPKWTPSGTTMGNSSIFDNGNVGIGTTIPIERLHISNGNILLDRGFYLKSKRNGELTNLIGVKQATRIIEVGEATTFPSEVRILAPTDPGDGVSIHNGTDHIAFFRNDGNVGIGTTSPAFKLDVCGNIRAKEVEVDALWCDFVFEKDYEVMSLTELEQYIKVNKHLPGILSSTIIEDQGLKLGEMTSKMMQKIEELTLYLIEHEKELKQLKKENEVLKNQLNKTTK